jgi:hypothetical protein
MATRSKLSQSVGRATMARVLSRVAATWPDVDTLGVIAMFCGVGLLLTMYLVTFGLDLSDGFF